jgi:hypothetical protein
MAVQSRARILACGGVSGTGGRAYCLSWVGGLLAWNFSVTRSTVLQGCGEKNSVKYACRCISDSLLAYRLNIPPAKAVHWTILYISTSTNISCWFCGASLSTSPQRRRHRCIQNLTYLVLIWLTVWKWWLTNAHQSGFAIDFRGERGSI